MSFPYRPGLLCHQTSKISRLEASPSQNICFCQCTCVIWTMPTLDREPTTKPHFECEGLGWGGSTFVVLQDLGTHLLHPFAIWIYHLDFSLTIISRRSWFFAFELVEHTCWQAYQQRLVTVSAWSHGLPCQSAPTTRRLQLSHGPQKNWDVGQFLGWDGLGCTAQILVIRKFSHDKTSPNLMIHFWVSTGMLVGNPSEGPSHFPLELELVSSGSLISASFKGGIPLDTTSIKTANPVVKRVQTHRSSLPRDNCQGQRFGESCYITCRAPREESRDGTGNNSHCAGFFVLRKNTRKNTITQWQSSIH